jgi:hypothetical protein
MPAGDKGARASKRYNLTASAGGRRVGDVFQNLRHRKVRRAWRKVKSCMGFTLCYIYRLLRCQNSRDIVYLERDTIALIKQLSLGGTTRQVHVKRYTFAGIVLALQRGPSI